MDCTSPHSLDNESLASRSFDGRSVASDASTNAGWDDSECDLLGLVDGPIPSGVLEMRVVFTQAERELERIQKEHSVAVEALTGATNSIYLFFVVFFICINLLQSLWKTVGGVSGEEHPQRRGPFHIKKSNFIVRS